MTTQTAKAREFLELARLAALAEGNVKRADNIQLFKEYFTNPDFRAGLADLVWDTLNPKDQ